MLFNHNLIFQLLLYQKYYYLKNQNLSIVDIQSSFNNKKD
jgi:hypothetical protein